MLIQIIVLRKWTYFLQLAFTKRKTRKIPNITLLHWLAVILDLYIVWKVPVHESHQPIKYSLRRNWLLIPVVDLIKWCKIHQLLMFWYQIYLWHSVHYLPTSYQGCSHWRVVYRKTARCQIWRHLRCTQNLARLTVPNGLSYFFQLVLFRDK